MLNFKKKIISPAKIPFFASSEEVFDSLRGRLSAEISRLKIHLRIDKLGVAMVIAKLPRIDPATPKLR